MSLDRTPDTDGAMGAAVEWIAVAAGSGFDAINLAMAYVAWRATRKQRPTMLIEVGDAKVSIPEGATAEDIELLIRALRSDSP